MAKNIENEYGIKVGDIFVCSWGYSMTLVNAYKVVSVSAKRCKIQEMVCEIVEGDGWMGKKAVVEGSENGEIYSAGCRLNVIRTPYGTGYKHEFGKTYSFNTLD